MKKSWSKKNLAAGVATAVLLFSAFTPAAYANTGNTVTVNANKADLNAKDLEAFADEFFAKAMQEANIPGLSFAVVKDGKTLLKKGYGYAHIDQKLKMDPNKTTQRVASISKIFTAIAVMQLQEQNKLDINVDINQYLGEDLQFDNPFPTPLTLKHLLAHTSGFAPNDTDLEGIFTEDLTTYTELVDRVRNQPKIVREPGEAAQYDNYAYDVAGYIVERVSGVPFETYVQENICKPLGLANTSFMPSEELISNMQGMYTSKLTLLPNYSMKPTATPSGSLITTAEDMTHFMIALLNGGRNNGKQILSSQSVAEMRKVQFALHPKVPNVGYGYEQRIVNGYQVVEKSGDLPGASSMLSLIPEKNVGIFLSYNRWGANPDPRTPLIKAFLERYFPQETPPKPEPTLETPKSDLGRFEGTYGDTRWQDILMNQITATGDGELMLTNTTFGAEAPGVKLRQVEPLLFVAPDGSYYTFKEDENHNIEYLNASIFVWGKKMPSFTDVPTTSPYSKYIDSLHNANIVMGNPDGSFAPTASVTRGQFVTMVTNLLKLPTSQNPVVFTDSKESIYSTAIQTAYENGLVAGTSATTFEPDALVTREQGAAIIWNALKKRGESPMQANLAGTTSDWAKTAVQTIVAKKFYGPEVTTLADGSIDYKSQNTMNRQESAALVCTTKLHLDSQIFFGLKWFQ